MNHESLPKTNKFTNLGIKSLKNKIKLENYRFLLVFDWELLQDLGCGTNKIFNFGIWWLTMKKKHDVYLKL